MNRERVDEPVVIGGQQRTLRRRVRAAVEARLPGAYVNWCLDSHVA